jgi:hypothetical protein
VGLAGLGPTARADIITDLIGHWTFDETTGTTAQNAADPGSGDGTLKDAGSDLSFSFDTNSSRGNPTVTHMVGTGALWFDGGVTVGEVAGGDIAELHDTAVPEPTSVVLLLLAPPVLGARRRLRTCGSDGRSIP